MIKHYERVSIIIPVFNAEKYLEECIESVLNQSYPNIEIIAVNDGSKDKSPEILLNYSNRIKIISKENGGVVSAMNAGIKEMTGDWLKILGADDVMYPNAVEELVKIGNKLENKKKWIIISNFHYIDSEGKIIEEFVQPDFNSMNKFDVDITLLDHFIGNAITSLIHKSAIDEYGMFNENFRIAPDLELWERYCILHNVRLWVVKKFLIKYRIHENMLTQKIGKKKIKEEDEKIRKFILSQLKNDGKKRYEEGLKKFRYIPLNLRIKYSIDKIMFKYLSKSTSDKIVNTYRKILGRQPLS